MIARESASRCRLQCRYRRLFQSGADQADVCRLSPKVDATFGPCNDEFSFPEGNRRRHILAMRLHVSFSFYPYKMRPVC